MKIVSEAGKGKLVHEIYVSMVFFGAETIIKPIGTKPITWEAMGMGIVMAMAVLGAILINKKPINWEDMAMAMAMSVIGDEIIE